MKIRALLSILMAIAAASSTFLPSATAGSQETLSKISACEQLETGLGRFNYRFTSPLNDRKDSQQSYVEQLALVLNQEVDQLEQESFSDDRVQGLYQQALEAITEARNQMQAYLAALSQQDTAQADTAYGALQRIPMELDQVFQDFDRYCQLAPTATWMDKALGVYQSQIWSGDRLVNGTTVLTKDENGVIEGDYTLLEDTGVVNGRLSHCQPFRSRIMSCQWTDQYGVGFLDINFAKDFASFEGLWGKNTSHPQFDWLGSR